MSLDDYESLEETDYLLRSPKNAKRLRAAIGQLRAGRGTERELPEVPLSIQHTARSGKIYYLHVGTDKKGRPRYFVSTKPDGPLADSIPEGYELYETVNAQVYFRKKRESPIRARELALVEQALRKHAEDWQNKAEIDKDMIVVHESRQDPEFWTEMAPPWADRSKIEQWRIRRAHYMPVMRFILVDAEARAFRPERFCFKGSVDDWIEIGPPGELASLLRQFITHLGKDSFFDLMRG